MLPPKATKNTQIGYEIEYEIMIIKTVHQAMEDSNP